MHFSLMHARKSTGFFNRKNVLWINQKFKLIDGIKIVVHRNKTNDY